MLHSMLLCETIDIWKNNLDMTEHVIKGKFFVLILTRHQDNALLFITFQLNSELRLII